MDLKIRPAISSRVNIEDAGALVAVTLSGVLDLRDCLTVLAALNAATKGSPARAVLVDARAAAFTLSPNDYLELVRALLWTPVAHPVAVVAGPWIMRIASAHELALKRRGHSQRFFDSQEAAMRWLSRLRRAPAGRDLLA